MRHPRVIAGALAVAGVAVAGGVALAATGGSSGYSSGNASGNAAPTATTGSSSVHTATVNVAGMSETALVDAQGDPLYYYQPDTATTSNVNGRLAALWPPVTSSASPTSIAGGQLTAVNDAHGSQAAYNGHLLYTFVSDSPGMATGQGVENFFLATPGLASAPGTAPAPARRPRSTPSSGSGGYGY